MHSGQTLAGQSSIVRAGQLLSRAALLLRFAGGEVCRGVASHVLPRFHQRAKAFIELQLFLFGKLRGKYLAERRGAWPRCCVNEGGPGHHLLFSNIDVQLEMHLGKARLLKQRDQVPFRKVRQRIALYLLNG